MRVDRWMQLCIHHICRALELLVVVEVDGPTRYVANSCTEPVNTDRKQAIGRCLQHKKTDVAAIAKISFLLAMSSGSWYRLFWVLPNLSCLATALSAH
jgi:hypothetical protein